MENLKKIRKKENKTQKEVANDLKIAQSTYNGYEKGHSKPDIETLKKLADYFRVSVDYLIEHETNSINLDELTLLQKNIIKKIINSSELICTKVEAYLNGLTEGEKEQEKVINMLLRGNKK